MSGNLYNQIDINRLYKKISQFNSLNFIEVKINSYNSVMNIVIEFYEDEYIFEILNNHDDLDNSIQDLKHNSILAIFYNLSIEYSFSNKKRINFNRNNIHESVFINAKPEIEYERN